MAVKYFWVQGVVEQTEIPLQDFALLSGCLRYESAVLREEVVWSPRANPQIDQLSGGHDVDPDWLDRKFLEVVY